MLVLELTSFGYQEKVILKDILFQLETGRHLALLGESGSGKSTLLHIIYGLFHLEEGRLSWKGEKLLGPKHNLIPGEPFMKLVSQEFDLMPFTTAAENIATHLSRRDLQKDDQRVKELLEVVDMVPFGNSLVKTLSGGQKQRVALAKALAKEPELLLLDEPFSNIDTFRKNKLRRNLFEYLKEKNITCISATHDSEEALAFSDEILMLKQGAMELYGPSEKVYQSIATPYQAGFFGEVNVLPAHLVTVPTFKNEAANVGQETVLLPHQLKVSGGETKLKAVVLNSYFKGGYYLVHCKFNDLDLYFNHPSKLMKDQIIYLERNSF